MQQRPPSRARTRTTGRVLAALLLTTLCLSSCAAPRGPAAQAGAPARIACVDPASGTVTEGECASTDETGVTTDLGDGDGDTTVTAPTDEYGPPLSEKDLETYLGRNGAADPALVDAPGLSWGDGSPVRATTTSVRQALRATGEAAPKTITFTPAARESYGDQEEVFGDLTELGSTLVAVTSPGTDAEGNSLFDERLVYRTGSTWHDGPRLNSADADWSLSALLAHDGRIYLTRGSDAKGWNLLSWAPGEKSLRTLSSSDDLPTGVTPGQWSRWGPKPSIAAFQGRLYVELPDTIGSEYGDAAPPSLGSVRLSGGGLRLVAQNGSRPTGSKDGVLYVVEGEGRDESGLGNAPQAVNKMDAKGRVTTILKVSSEEINRRTDITDQPTAEDTSTAQTVQQLAPTVLGLSPRYLTLLLRGQPLAIDLTTRKAHRVVMASALSAELYAVPVQCGSRLTFVTSLTVTQDQKQRYSSQLLLDLDAATGTVHWRIPDNNAATFGCLGNDPILFQGMTYTEDAVKSMTYERWRLG